MTHGKGKAADERAQRRIDDRAFDGQAADRIGSIEDDDRNAGLACGLHDVREGVDEGVEAGADVLEVIDDRVEAGEVRRLGPQRTLGVAVQADDRQSGGAIDGASDGLHVLCLASNAMLRSEQAGDLEAPVADESIHQVPAARVDRRRMRDDAQSRPAEEARAVACGIEERVEAGAHAMHHGSPNKAS